jgi:hypothetical protein
MSAYNLGLLQRNASNIVLPLYQNLWVDEYKFDTVMRSRDRQGVSMDVT